MRIWGLALLTMTGCGGDGGGATVPGNMSFVLGGTNGVLPFAPFAPVRDQRFVAGLHRWNNRWIHVTKGIGSVFGMRINCPPEISCLTLT